MSRVLPPQSPEAKAAYDARWQRILDCIALKQPDRMPVALYATFWLARYGGITARELMYDYEKTNAISERAMLEFEPDVGTALPGIAMGPVLERMGYKQIQWPGHGVGENQPYQYLDREYMTADEYDEFIFDPTGFYLHKYLPRVAEAFEGFDQLPVFPGICYLGMTTAIRPFAKQSVRKSFERIVLAAEEGDRFARHVGEFIRRMYSHGYPMINLSSLFSPYDFIADYFRGAKGMMKDMFRHRDKLLAMLDKTAIFLTRKAIDTVRGTGNPIVFIPIHWAPDAFMSAQQFETFWWPPFRKMMLGMIEAGLVPMPLWESDCTKRLETIRDIPPGKCIYWFERTDMVKAFEVLGDVVALRGNLSPSMMTTGTPQEVDAAVKHLVDNVWKKGGSLILDTAFGIPDETPVANVRAMFDAARKYAG